MLQLLVPNQISVLHDDFFPMLQFFHFFEPVCLQKIGAKVESPGDLSNWKLFHALIQKEYLVSKTTHALVYQMSDKAKDTCNFSVPDAMGFIVAQRPFVNYTTQMFGSLNWSEVVVSFCDTGDVWQQLENKFIFYTPTDTKKTPQYKREVPWASDKKQGLRMWCCSTIVVFAVKLDFVIFWDSVSCLKSQTPHKLKSPDQNVSGFARYSGVIKLMLWWH